MNALARRIALLAILLVPAPVAAAPDVHVHGLLDLGLASSNDARLINEVTFAESNFDPYRLRLFLDARLATGLEVHVQSLFSEGLGSARADGAYALWTPWPRRDLAVEAGKIPWPIGTYAPRTYSDRNWLIGTPLIYQYRTGLVWNTPQADADQLVAEAGHGQVSPNPDHTYLPVIDERWWDTGAVVVGSFRPVEFSGGVTQGSLSWPSPGIDDTPGQTVLGRIGYVPLPGVRVGVSGADGTWMPSWFATALPAGRSLREYRETTLMGDGELARGPFEMRGEVVRRRWQTIGIGTLDVGGGYGEARWSFVNGASLAVRGEILHFSDVTTSAAVTRPWDDPVHRWEGVIGYRVTRDVRVKVGAQRTIRQPFDAPRVRTDFLTASMSLRF